MADISLTDFFAAHHGCNDWTLQKAVYQCTWRALSAAQEGNVQSAPARKTRGAHEWNTVLAILQEKARQWDPATFFHQTLKKIMLAPDLKTLEKIMPVPKQISTSTTRVRKQLEAWLYDSMPSAPSSHEERLNQLHIDVGRYKEHQAFEAARIRKLTHMLTLTGDPGEAWELNHQLQSAIAMETVHAIALSRAQENINVLERAKK
jgi:hypothetical protein